MTIKTNRFTSILFIFSLLLGAPLFATTFYVDASNGNDSNNGTSTSSAWKTLNKVNSKTFSPDDNVLFNKGNTFYGRLMPKGSGTATQHITFGSYGSGQKPIITSVQSINHTWTNIGGNIWKSNEAVSNHPERLIKNNIEILRATSQSGLNAQYNWYYGGNLYIYSTSNPANDSFKYSILTDTVSMSDLSYIDFRDLEVQGGRVYAMYIYGSAYITLKNITLGKYARSGIYVSRTAKGPSHHVVIDSCIIDTKFTLNYWNAGDGASTLRGTNDGIMFNFDVHDNEIKNSFFKNWGHASMNILTSNNNKIYNNELTAPDLPYGGRLAMDGNMHHTEVYNNYIHNVSNPSQVNGHDNHFHNNIIDGVINTPLHVQRFAGKGFAIQSYNGPVYNNIYENNTIMNTENTGFSISGDFGKGQVYNNVIRNNIFYNCGILKDREGQGIMMRINPSENVHNNTIDNNLFYSPITKKTVLYRQFSPMLTIQETTSALSHGDIFRNNSDLKPEFVSLSNKDYHLVNNSVFLTNGVKPKALYDFAGNPINAPYSIGAYQTSEGGPIMMQATSSAVTEPAQQEPAPAFKTGPWKATPPQAGKKKGVLE